MVALRVNPDTGLRDDASSVSEYFFAEYPPAGRGEGLAAPVPGRTTQDVRDQLF